MNDDPRRSIQRERVGKPSAGFGVPGQQYYRYRWLHATAASGQFEAEAGLDDDGTNDGAMQLGLHCVAGSCVIEPLLETPWKR